MSSRPRSQRESFGRLVRWVRGVAENHPWTILLALLLWPLGSLISFIMGVSLLSGVNDEPPTKEERRVGFQYIFGGLIWPVIVYAGSSKPPDLAD